MRPFVLLLVCPVLSSLACAEEAVLKDRRLSIRQPLIEFALPEKWKVERGETLHIAADELKKVQNGSGEWDLEFAAVTNAAIPFERCIAHFGEEAWAEKAISFADLQVRVYVVDFRTGLLDSISEAASSGARRFSDDVTIEQESESEWSIVTVSFPLWFHDYGGTAKVTFYIQRFDSKVLILAFMYSNYPGKQIEDISAIISSMKQSEPNQPSEPTAPSGRGSP